MVLFYPGWVVLSAISLPIAWVLARIFISPLGLFIGLLQYLLLRRYLPRMGMWVVATVSGWLLLDKPPQREGHGGTPPIGVSLEQTVLGGID